METHELIAARYRLEEAVGAGGMGTVWRATDERLERTVAVKVLNEAIRHDPGAAERFRREAQIAASVEHPAIARVYEFVDGDHPAIIMEYVEGETLADRLRRGPLAHGEAEEIILEVLAALASAHAAGVIHRDVKPGNVLLGVDGTVKLADLGIARAAGDQTMTMTGAVLGSVHYCSPERLRGEDATPASDVYGVGAVLYEMLTGRRPFEGESPAAVMAAHLSQRPEPPRALDPTIPARLDDVAMRALEPEVARRFRDADVMRAALMGEQTAAFAVDGGTGILPVVPDEETVVLSEPPVPVPRAAVVPPPWFRRRAVAVLVPAMLLAFIASVVAFTGDGAPEAAPSPRATQEAEPVPPPDVGAALASLLTTIVEAADAGQIAEKLDDELIHEVDEIRRAARDGDRSKALDHLASLRERVGSGWDTGEISGRSVIRRLRSGIADLAVALEALPDDGPSEPDPESEDDGGEPGHGKGNGKAKGKGKHD